MDVLSAWIESPYCEYKRNRSKTEKFWAGICLSAPNGDIVKKAFVIFGGGVIFHEKWKELCREADEVIERFYPLETDGDRIREDILYSCFVYGTTPAEYAMFGFHTKNHQGRMSYLCDKERFEIFRQFYDFKSYENIRNKWNQYQRNKRFFGRGCLLIRPEGFCDEAFHQFFHENREFIFKPLRSYCGMGVEKVRTWEASSCEALYNALAQTGGGMAEQLIVQAKAVGQFNPSSVNTVRAVTLLDGKGHVEFVSTFLRTGRNGAIVDNGGSGGIFANIDIDMGLVVTCGHDEMGGVYAVHPDSGVPFVGFQVPFWREMKQFAVEVASNNPQFRFLGLDLALQCKAGYWWRSTRSPRCLLHRYVKGGGISVRFCR